MLQNKEFPQAAHCQCGDSHFTVKGAPILRFVCHCLICQAYTGKPYNDVTVLRAVDVDMPSPDKVSYRRYRRPPNISRGSCRACGKPVIETGGAWPLRLAFVPSDNYSNRDALPPVAMHIFCHRRVAEITDAAPQYSGYLASELQVVRGIIAGLFRRRRARDAQT